MAIDFECSACGTKMRTGDKYAGRSLKCPRCASKVTVPEPVVAPRAPVVAAAPPRPAAAAEAHSPDQPLFRPSQGIDFEDLIDMTAMVDIVFFLLIFFLVTSMNPLDSTIPLPAPDSQSESAGKGSPSAEASEEASITVRIDRNDAIWVDDVEVHGRRELLFRLRDLINGPSRPEAMNVMGSADATHGTTVMVLDSGHEAGLEHVRLAIRDETE